MHRSPHSKSRGEGGSAAAPAFQLQPPASCPPEAKTPTPNTGKKGLDFHQTESWERGGGGVGRGDTWDTCRPSGQGAFLIATVPPRLRSSSWMKSLLTEQQNKHPGQALPTPVTSIPGSRTWDPEVQPGLKTASLGHSRGWGGVIPGETRGWRGHCPAQVPV